jgi:hypothetical protein
MERAAVIDRYFTELSVEPVARDEGAAHRGPPEHLELSAIL